MEKKDGLPVYREEDFMGYDYTDGMEAGDVFYYVTRHGATHEERTLKLTVTQEERSCQSCPLKNYYCHGIGCRVEES